MANITFSEASNVADSVYGKSQYPIRMLIEKRGEEFEAKSALPFLFNITSSKNWAEKMTTMTAFDNFKPVGENGAYPVAGTQEGFSKAIEHMTWRSSFSLSHEIVADAKALDLKNRPTGFVASAYRTREQFGASMFGAGITGASNVTMNGFKFDATGADGVTVFNTAHPSKLNSSNTQGNLFSDDFSADALSAMETAMQTFEGDNGELLDVSPDTIVIPNLYALKKSVFAAIGADKDPATANNGFNYQFGRWNVVVWGYLNKFITSGTAPWILLDSEFNKTYGGAMWFDREPLTIRSTISDENDANVWLGRMRYGVGFNDWRFAACGGVSGGTALISD